MPAAPTLPAANRLRASRFLALLSAVVLSVASSARAQWVTESYRLDPGWNGIWLSHDCSYATIDTLLAGYPAIKKIVQWSPSASTTQFLTSPANPIAPDVSWKVWERGVPEHTTLKYLVGNAGYLVEVTSLVFLPLTGQPLLPEQSFKSSGLNFTGFPMATPVTGSHNIRNFFSYSATLKKPTPSGAPVFTYLGGPLSDVPPKNPRLITTPGDYPFYRNNAYWVQTTTYSNYYGPIRVGLLGAGINFGDTGNTVTLRLKNVIDPARNLPVTATLTPAPSATPPTGQPAIVGPVPLLVRGPRDSQTLEFTYTPLTGAITRTLAPGEEIDVVLALNRPALGSTAGLVFQSLLQVSDSLGLTRIDLGVRAVSTSFTGLWVGAAVVNKVDQIIGPTTVAGADAKSNFPIRLILHRATSGATTLLQQVYLGDAAGTPIASATETSITSIANSRPSRLSSASFPISTPPTWTGSGQLGPSGPVTFTVPLGFNDKTNPFVHTYHPDHDNLDARGERLLVPGTDPDAESFNVNRDITLNFTPANPGASDPTLGSTTLSGTYSETITGLRSAPGGITVSGAFLLRRVSDVPTLTP